MKAKHAGRCMSCKQSIQVGAEIARLLGKYVHQGCKDQHLAAIRSEGRTEVLPDRMEGLVKFTARKEYQRPHVGHTRGIRKVT